MTPLRPSILVAGVAAVVLLTGGCAAGSGGAPSGAGHAGAGTAAGPARSAADAPPTSAGGGSSPTTATAPACRANSLRATLDVQPAVAGGRERALLVATNAGPSPCTVDGYAGLSGQPGGARIVHIDLSTANRPVPLAGGASAFAAAEWTAATSCPAVAALALSVSGSAGRADVAIDVPGGVSGPLHLCPGKLEVGPFAATAMAARFPAPGGPMLAGCRAGVLAGSLFVPPAAPKAAVTDGRLVLTNRSRQDCETGGYVGVRLLGVGGTAISAAVGHGPDAAATPIDIGAGQSVSAALRFTPGGAGAAGDKASCDLRAAAIEVRLPGQQAAITVRSAPVRVCPGGAVVVGALQAGAGG